MSTINELYHYGVKGMKWHMHRFGKRISSSIGDKTGRNIDRAINSTYNKVIDEKSRRDPRNAYREDNYHHEEWLKKKNRPYGTSDNNKISKRKTGDNRPRVGSSRKKNVTGKAVDNWLRKRRMEKPRNGKRVGPKQSIYVGNK